MTLEQDRPLRIAIFSDSYRPILNGVSVSIDALVAGLRHQGHSVHIFTAAHFGYRDPDPNTYRFPSTPTPWTKGYPLAVPPFYPMIRHFRRHRFDVIHTHTPFTVGFVGLRWGESHGIPVVATYHTQYDKYVHYIPLLPKRYLRYKLAKHTNFYYNSVSQVITPSPNAFKWLRRHSVKKPVTVIPTGVPVPEPIDRNLARQRLGLRPEDQVLLYVGRIAKEKNMETVIEAAHRAFAMNDRLMLWIVGDGPARGNCVELVRKLGVGDRVRFIGPVPRSEVDPYYVAADAFLFASMTETQGLVVAEAMSHGLPSVVVQGGGASAAIQDGTNGIIVRNDPRQMAAEVVQLLQNPDIWERMSQAARKAVGPYSIHDMTSDVLRVYRAAMDSPVASHAPEPELAFQHSLS